MSKRAAMRLALDQYESVPRVRVRDARVGNAHVLSNPRLHSDIYVPNLGAAVEYDGAYWHSRPEQKDWDAEKDRLCKRLHIKLMRVDDNHYRKDPDGETKRILAALRNLRRERMLRLNSAAQ